MKCPGCGKEVEELDEELVEGENINMFIQSCPLCHYVVKSDPIYKQNPNGEKGTT